MRVVVDSKRRRSPRRHAASRAAVAVAKPGAPPSEAQLLAQLPLATGARLEAVRKFLAKQRRVAEDLYFYGPRTGWAYRYLREGRSVATIMIHDDELVGILALDAVALAAIDFSKLSDVAQRAHERAHGSPSLLWLDLPLAGSGASDFKALLEAKLKTLAEKAGAAPSLRSPKSPKPTPPTPRARTGG